MELQFIWHFPLNAFPITHWDRTSLIETRHHSLGPDITHWYLSLLTGTCHHSLGPVTTHWYLSPLTGTCHHSLKPFITHWNLSSLTGTRHHSLGHAVTHWEHTYGRSISWYPVYSARSGIRPVPETPRGPLTLLGPSSKTLNPLDCRNLRHRPQHCMIIEHTSAHIPSFHISYYSITLILVYASFSYFTLAVSMREVPCVGYTPRAWDPRSPQSILNSLLYFRPLNSIVPKWVPLFSILVWFYSATIILNIVRM